MKIFLNILWSHLANKRRKQAIALLLFSIITSIFEVFTVGSIFNLLSYLTKLDQTMILQNENSTNNLSSVIELEYTFNNVFIIFIAFLLMACCCRIALLWLMIRFSHIIGNDVGTLMFMKILKQPIEYHFSTTTNEIISTLTKKIHILSLEIVQPIILVTTNIMIISVVIFYLLYTAGIMTLIGFVILIIIFYLFWKFSKSKILNNSKIISENADEIIKIISETLSAIKLISMKEIQHIFINRFSRINKKLKFAEGNNVFLSQSIRIWLELFIITFGTIFCYVSIKSGTFLNILPILGGVVFGIYRIIPLVLKAYSGFTTLMGAKESFNDILDFLQLNENDFGNKDLQKKVIFKNEIILSNVNYNYPLKVIPSLNNINCQIKKYSINGILGITGSGKTTLVSIIAGLLEPKEGNLFVDSKKINTSNVKSWQNKISYVPQETIIIDGSISDNITLVTQESIDNKRLTEALEIAKLEKFTPYLNSKEIIGERGIKISGGERQRIGIARAIYDNKEIIILDEPFSALDKKTAQKILSNIIKHKKFTVLIVTHDDFIVPFCDNIITLENGLLKNSRRKKAING